jgi:nitroreductase
VVALIHLGPPLSEPPAKERATLDDVLLFLD